MKQHPLLIALVLGVLCSNCTKEDYDEKYTISKMEACAIVKPYIDQFQLGPVLVAKKVIPAKKTLKYGEFGHYRQDNPYSGTTKSPNFKSYLIVRMADPQMDGTWDSHHYFVNVKNGDVVEQVLHGYVADIEWEESFWPYYPTSQEDDNVDENSYVPSSFTTKSENTSSSNGKYAVIISGGGEKENNWKRYWNNCKHIYNNLNHRLGFDDENIYCIVSDGTSSGKDRQYDWGEYDSSPLDFDNDGDNDIQYSASKNNISTVFNILQTQKPNIEELLVFVTDHGTIDGEINLWGNSTLSPSELDAELDKLAGVRIDVVMGQCYSGAFIGPLSSQNRTITTACSAYQQSYGAGWFSYDHFLHWWTNVYDQFNYIIEDYDTNNDGMYSIKEMFEYAVDNDPKAQDGSETPQYASTPAIFGYTHDLNANNNCPVVSGPNHLSTTFGQSFTISGLPSGTSVTWTSSDDIAVSNGTNTSVVATGNIQDYSQYISFPNYVSANFSLEGDPYIVTKNITAVWQPGYYYRPYGSGTIYGGNGHYTLTEPLGASGFYWMSDNSAWQILTQGSIDVQVSEGTTYEPVNLAVSFTNPLGETIAVSECVKL